MLTFELESYEDGRYVYVYYPEDNREAPGRVAPGRALLFSVAPLFTSSLISFVGRFCSGFGESSLESLRSSVGGERRVFAFFLMPVRFSLKFGGSPPVISTENTIYSGGSTMAKIRGEIQDLLFNSVAYVL